MKKKVMIFLLALAFGAVCGRAADGNGEAVKLWKLARECVIKGEGISSKEQKRELYAKAVDYAAKAIALDPTDPNAYMWHCASVGRECQTHNLMSQASKVPVMRKDLETILNSLGRTDFGVAWQALAELYCHHPFLSNDTAVNYARAAACETVGDDTHVYSCKFLAKLLKERNWSAQKRASALKGNAASFAATKPNTEKYAYFEASADAALKSVWCKGSLAGISDSQEAAMLSEYVKSIERR